MHEEKKNLFSPKVQSDPTAGWIQIIIIAEVFFKKCINISAGVKADLGDVKPPESDMLFSGFSESCVPLKISLEEKLFFSSFVQMAKSLDIFASLCKGLVALMVEMWLHHSAQYIGLGTCVQSRIHSCLLPNVPSTDSITLTWKIISAHQYQLFDTFQIQTTALDIQAFTAVAVWEGNASPEPDVSTKSGTMQEHCSVTAKLLLRAKQTEKQGKNRSVMSF